MRSKLKMRQRLAEHSSRTPEISIGSRVTEAGALRKALPASRTGRSRWGTSPEAPRASYFWRLVGQHCAGAAGPDAANCADSAFPQILDQRYLVRVADDLRRGKSRACRGRRLACLVAEPLSFIQVTK